jgi:excisionase family DNA binding protein
MGAIQENGYQGRDKLPGSAAGMREATKLTQVSKANSQRNEKLSVANKEAKPSVVIRQQAEAGDYPISEKPLAITKKEAARLLSISERTLFQLVADGEIPVVRLKRKVLFRPADLNAWLHSKSDTKN